MDALFIADDPGLDFLNSIATPADLPIDWIADGEGLLSWLRQARLAPDEALDDLKMHALPGELDKVADKARFLREWFRGFVMRHKGGALKLAGLEELAPLNRLLERDEAFNRIELHDGKPDLMASRRWRDPDSLLLPIGAVLARLVCAEDFTHIKQCEGPVCTLLFADHTKSHARRWCSMALCGNRAKQAAHRHRLKEQG